MEPPTVAERKTRSSGEKTTSEGRKTDRSFKNLRLSLNRKRTSPAIFQCCGGGGGRVRACVCNYYRVLLLCCRGKKRLKKLYNYIIINIVTRNVRCVLRRHAKLYAVFTDVRSGEKKKKKRRNRKKNKNQRASGGGGGGV